MSIGPYKFAAPIPYLHKYHTELPPPSRTLLYRILIENPKALAVFFTNNDYIGVVYQKMINYMACYREDFISYNFDKPLSIPELIPIGYIKTYCECKTVFTMPYKLMYMQNGHCIWLNEKWIPIDEEPSLVFDLSLYKELIGSNYEACYKDKSGKTIYLR
jgi:hypothetical protein